MKPSSALIDGFVLRRDVSPTGDGPLAGFTFGVKDVFDLAGTLTGCGNPSWAASHPPAAAHAVVVEQLLAAGARCVGKTVTDEFAFSLIGENHFYGTPPNPHAPDRVPGGSSSGSASVVAAGHADFALGTDTAGSIRVPAAYCGLYGLRPTWGRISAAGVQPLAPSFDTVGLLARNATVLKQVAGVLLPRNNDVAITQVFMLEDAWDLADADVQAIHEIATNCLSLAGLTVKSVTLSALVSGEPGTDLFAWKRTFSGAQWPEIWSTFGTWLEATQPPIGPKIAGNFSNVKAAGRANLTRSLGERASIREVLHAFLTPECALCLPTAASVAPVCGQVDYDRAGTGALARTLCLTAPAGLSGLPQISVPANTAEGLPAGVSFLAAANADLALVDLAQACGDLT